LLLYALAGEAALGARYGMTTEWRLALEDAAYSMLGIGHPVEIAPSTLPLAESRLVTWYHRSLSVLGLGFVVFVAVGSLRPARHRRRHRAEVTRVTELLHAHGDSTVAAFARADDADYFFSRNGRAVIAYRFESDVLLGIGDPIGPEEELAPLLRDFEAHCREREWRFAFYQARPERLALYDALGWRRLEVGLDPVLFPDRFTLEGGAIGAVRRAVHKAERAGLVVQHFLPGGADDGARHLAELQAISQEWLRAHPGGEKNFCMGRFDPRHLAETWWSVAWNPARGRIEGFTTWEPIWARHGWGLDLMRRRHDAPEGTMELLVVRAVEAARERGDALLSLGLAALAREDADGAPDAPETESARVRAFLTAQLERFYDFAGVFTWKRKFDPVFEPRYLVYPSALDLPFVAVALARAQSPGGFRAYLARLRPRPRAEA
jgi:phosphatidylglycerol lysyltransferase